MAVEIEKTNVRLILCSLNTFLSPEMLLTVQAGPHPIVEKQIIANLDLYPYNQGFCLTFSS